MLSYYSSIILDSFNLASYYSQNYAGILASPLVLMEREYKINFPVVFFDLMCESDIYSVAIYIHI